MSFALTNPQRTSFSCAALLVCSARRFFVAGAVLCIGGRGGASLVSAHQMPVAPLPSANNQKWLQTWTNGLLVEKHSWKQLPSPILVFAFSWAFYKGRPDRSTSQHQKLRSTSEHVSLQSMHVCLEPNWHFTFTRGRSLGSAGHLGSTHQRHNQTPVDHLPFSSSPAETVINISSQFLKSFFKSWRENLHPGPFSF